MNPIAEIINYIEVHWIAWLFALFSILIGVLYRKLDHIAKASSDRNRAMSEGLQALLRSEIIDKYNHYRDKAYCPIYAKENVKRLYKPYRDLGGNGVVEKLVDEMLTLPTKEEESENNG